MIIEAKANRPQSEPDNPRKRLDFNTPEKTSRLPVYFALLITGIAAYLRSAFPARSQSDPPHSEDGLPAGNSNAPRSGRMESGPGIDDTMTGSIGDEADNSIGQSRHSWHTGLALHQGEPFAYSASSFDYFGPHVAAFFPAAFDYQPQNDNAAVSATDGGDPIGPGGDTPTDDFVPMYPPLGDDARTIDNDNDDEEDDGDEDDDDEEDDEDEEDPDQTAPANRAPMVMGPVRLNDVFAGQVMLIGLSHLLFGASDPDGDVLTINDITVTGGTLVQVGSGWSFITIPGMLGVITFTYDISDGLLDIVQTATLEVVRNTIALTPYDDVFVGTPYDDDIDALSGDDIIDARAGNDVVVGGLGDDHINGGAGDDQLFGGFGNDVIFGGSGNDVIGGGEGRDRLFGEDGDDIIDGDEGDDLLVGGAGDDILDGGSDNDELDGGEGDDVLIAGAGDDTASGGEGNDVVQGDAGADHLDGGAGDDAIDGGEGCDTLLGGDGDDTLIAAAGNDLVQGGAGHDHLQGDEGEDTLLGEAGDDWLLGGEDDDALYGGGGNDLIAAGGGDDEIEGGSGDDRIMGDAGFDLIDGGEGQDTLDYSDFTADIHLDFELGIAWGDDINEDLFQNIEEVIGGSGDDTFAFGSSTAIIAGGAGDDLFIFTVTEETAALSRQLVFEILDFVVGDRIHVAEYELSHRAERLEAERFGEIYDELEEGFEAGLPIRVTHAYYDDMDHTIIEADVDRNDIYEISITLDGVQLPFDNHVA